jgi:hypothetical protein
LHIAYHRVREAVTAKVIVIAHVPGTNNVADIATKVLGAVVVWNLLSNLLYGRNTSDFSPVGELQRYVLTEPASSSRFKNIHKSTIRDK